jgi:hypothetical protein
MEDVGIFNGHSVYFTAIRHILWTLCIFCGNLIYTVLVYCVRKNLATLFPICSRRRGGVQATEGEGVCDRGVQRQGRAQDRLPAKNERLPHTEGKSLYAIRRPEGF